MREWSGGLMCGCFTSKAKPIFYEGIPEKSEFLTLPEDWDHFRKSSSLSADLFCVSDTNHLNFKLFKVYPMGLKRMGLEGVHNE